MRISVVLYLLAAATPNMCNAQLAAPLPSGVEAVWGLGTAYREATTTRERVCVNGLWRWQPAGNPADAVPTEGWGYFKVPGPWPGISSYIQKDCQTVFPHPAWKDRRLGVVTAAWYQREIEVPGDWVGRRITLDLSYVNSLASVFVDGKPAGDVRFPGGEADLTASCRPGSRHLLSLLVTAMPLKAVMMSNADSAAAKQVKGRVERRGLCGDVYLVGTPAGARLDGVRIDTSVRRSEISFNAALRGLTDGARYTLSARVTDAGREVAAFTSPVFDVSGVKNGRFIFSANWKPERLWDLHTPNNVYDVQVTLRDAAGGVLDADWSRRFGFRELWIEGRDFYLNGTRVFLSAVPMDNGLVGAAWADYAAAHESMERLKAIGINFVYTHNYGCEPGTHLSYEEILRAADDVGMLVAVSQPHFSQYDWQGKDAVQNNGYARHAEFYTRVAGSHPSVVFYSMSHNIGYGEDMNPDHIDGKYEPNDPGAMRNGRLAMQAEGIVRRLDPSRIVYHHAGGNRGSVYTVNFYANFTPVQEMSDWFGHWATEGVKPLFLCEYGVPMTWDWTMYRGWYKGNREFGSAEVPWEFCLAEWNAQFLGDKAFDVGEAEKANIRWEAKQFRAGKLWHRWDYPYAVDSEVFEERSPVFAEYITANWRAFRTWGVSANCPWQYGHFWKLRDGVDHRGKELSVDWNALQRPGFSPDYLDQQYARMDLAYERSDWVPLASAQALLRNNQPLLAYIAGKPAAFTSQDHNFRPGEMVEKQLVIVNNSRRTVTGDCEWTLRIGDADPGARQIVLPTGEQLRITLSYELPKTLTPGRYELKASVKFNDGQEQADSFWIDVLTPPAAPRITKNVALFDPRGQTGSVLRQLGVQCRPVEAGADLSTYDVLIVGKDALTIDGRAPDIGRVREGLKVILFEQTSQVLEKRLGFRVEEYGLRRVFPRIPDHPLLSGMAPDRWSDWRGEATLLPPRLTYETKPRYGPLVKWCDIPVTRAWRCGNRGNVASVLIEKPARGDFRPLLDGGYGLQYSPLLEYREGKGLVLFCQIDVSGRTERDPAAEVLVRNILEYAATWEPSPSRRVVYAGEAAGLEHLRRSGFEVANFEGGDLAREDVLVVGPGAGTSVSSHARSLARWLEDGGHLLAVGLADGEANAFLPFKIATRNAEHIAAEFEAGGVQSPLAGVGPADVQNREPRMLPLVRDGATVVGDGILAHAEAGRVVFCQIAPWQFSDHRTPNLKKTYRRTSFLLARLLGNMGVAGATPVLSRFDSPIKASKPEQRWLEGLYLDQPEEWDDPYRFFRW